MAQQRSLSRSSASGMRNNIDTMLMPFFPEDGLAERFDGMIDGHAVTIYTDQPGGRIASASDRKVLNLIAAQIAAFVRSGERPTRHVELGVRDVLEAIASDGPIGGSEYSRITQRLERLASTWITTEAPLSHQVARKRHFRWIDAFEQDLQTTPSGQKVLRLKISLSEDAFAWLTRNDGYDLSREEFRALTASRSSSWRIYEICLAQLLLAGGAIVRIPIEDIRQRVPITAELKVFKARTLKAAMRTIAENPEMAKAIRVSLERKTEDGGFEPLPEGKRASHDQTYVCVTRGNGPLPKLDRLLPASNSVEPEDADTLPLFRSQTGEAAM